MARTNSASAWVICDAGPLIHLHELDCLDLLWDFSNVLIPEAVHQEIRHHRPQALAQAGTRITAVEDPVISPTCSRVARAFQLHKGEMMALMLAQTKAGCLLLTDDTAARLAAQALQIPARGTLGVLVRAIRKNQRTKNEVLEILATMRTRSSLHVSISLLDEVMVSVERMSTT